MRAKSKSTLGKAVIRSRFKDRPRPNETGLIRHTTDMDDGPNWVKLQSVTQEGDLDAFLRTAELAGTEFTAEKLNVAIVNTAVQNPYLLVPEEERELLNRHEAHKERLTVPRRPAWDLTTSRDQLHLAEQDSFLTWRRDLARLEETEGLLLTPFERNLEVWRQLWRVIERSSLVVQIVDARNPLFFRSIDLVKYVKEVDPRKQNLLLVNKADFLTDDQRTQWAEYFHREGIQYLFFSAKKAAEEAELENDVVTAPGTESTDEDESEDETKAPVIATKTAAEPPSGPAPTPSHVAPATESPESSNLDIHILSADELVTVLKDKCPKINTAPLADTHTPGNAATTTATTTTEPPRRITIGLVGYPNVGKSSTINALLGAKKVAVGSTPGKTKHFQTLLLDEETVLCDCPGLVFPSFATTAADMVCNGVLPIDQLREYVGPSGLVAQRIPKWVLEAIYGMTIRVRAEEEGGTGVPTAYELLQAFAIARGLTRAGQGNPDESRAARHLLKDYVNGKLLYNTPPPVDAEGNPISGHVFNAELYDPQAIASRSHHVVVNADGGFEVKAPASNRLRKDAVTSTKVRSMDARFFETGAAAPAANTRGKYASAGFSRAQLYPHQRMVNERGEAVTDDTMNQRMAAMGVEVAGAKGLDPSGKKSHKKGKKHIKKRSGHGCDENY
ncbi:hypothetical protein IWQ60_006986 [Tieghemiomyces parasiticus]|uniref:CP-type G domain-containing protein n=1 Tax=Tieghemiomyces parasiticus TaxID=78921 RepID=A0A9W8A3U6_9FUNG|nr:hypothetical protein IWQ60_006986 [Tieghemiomyces parasiticus]